MQRQGAISPSLARFLAYQLHARDLEARKRNKPSSERQLGRWQAINDQHEVALDEAWQEVETIAAWYGDIPAAVISEKYLWDGDWHEISANHHLPYDLTKKLAYHAFLWLDMWRDAKMPPYDKGE